MKKSLLKTLIHSATKVQKKSIFKLTGKFTRLAYHLTKNKQPERDYISFLTTKHYKVYTMVDI